MADRGRDLQFRLLSDLSRFDTRAADRQLDDLGDTAKTLGNKVDDAFDQAKRSGDRFADDARGVARKVGDAFDAISRSSRKSARDIDDDLDKAGDGLDNFKDEAHQSGREAAASFSGGFDDIGDFIQETAANAFGGFGPIGAAAGIAAAAGIGIITAAFSSSKEKAEEARAAVSDWIQAYVDGLGTIQEATIQSNLAKFAEDGGKKLRELGDAARDAGVNVADYQRAQAGDIDAQRRVAQQYRAASERLAELSESRTADEGSISRQSLALQKIAGDLGYTNSQMAEGKRRADELRAASNRPISLKLSTQIKVPTAAELDRIRRDVRDGIGTIPVQLRVVGQSKFANNSNNSKYRW